MRETVYALKNTAFIPTSLSSYVNTQQNESNLIADYVDNVIDNEVSRYKGDDELLDDEYEKAVEDYKKSLTTQDVLDLCNCGVDDCFYDDLDRELLELKRYKDENAEKRIKEIEKLFEDRPDVYLYFTDKMLEDKSLKISENGFLDFNGYTYLYVSEY